MKYLLLLILSLSLFAADAEKTIRVMSFNIRYATESDGVNAWSKRKETVAGLISYHAPQILGMQEVTPAQLEFLAANLPQYGWVGVGREDGAQKGEYAPVFYRTDQFEQLLFETYWLSEQPEVPGSMGWDAAYSRIVTRVDLRERGSGEVFSVLNTHFDHRGETARLESARLVRKIIASVPPENRVILMGDFNLTPDAPGYAVITGDGKLRDARLNSRSLPYGPEFTFTAFGHTEERNRIDYIFVPEYWQIIRFSTIADNWDGFYPSDHFPVVADIQLSEGMPER
jgi:endonuclease/exonuclease/phosphatase family metal-dependent hydrolase